MNSSENKDSKTAGLNLPAQIILTVAAIGFAVGSALDPLGLVGILLAVLSSAMLTVLALGARSVPYALTTFLNAPIAYLACAYILTFAKGEPLESALVMSLAAIYPAVMALPIYLITASGNGRSVSIAASAVTSFALWAAYVALNIRLTSGSLSFEVLGELIDTAFAPAKEALASITFDRGDEVIRYYSDADIESMMYSVKTMLIGSAAALFIVISYLATLATRLIASCFELESKLPSSTCVRMKISSTEDGVTAELSQVTVPWRIELDSISAFVMIGAYIFSILFTSNSEITPVAITAQNLLLILLPGFIYAGARDIFGAGNPAGIGRGCLILPFSFVLVFINPLTLAVLLAIVGVTSVLRENRARSRAEHFLENKQFGGGFSNANTPSDDESNTSDSDSSDSDSSDPDTSDSTDDNDNDRD